MQVQSLLGVLVGASLLAGCPDRTISEVVPSQGRVETNDIPFDLNRNIDILFVIDDSGSMADKQANLAVNFPDFINVLNTIPGGLPDVHIGVVTSDMGAKSTTEANPPTGLGCSGTGKNGALQLSGAPVTGNNFISDISATAGGRTRNYTGDLATVFGQMAKVGTMGCGFEQHLHAMKAALDGTNAANAGFLRTDAYLAVIFIADEDDCSISKSSILGPPNATTGSQQSFRCTRFGVTCDTNGTTPDAMNQVGAKGQCHPTVGSSYIADVQPFVTFLKGLKPGKPEKVIVAGIMGPAEPVQVEMRVPQNGTVKEQALARSCTYQGATNVEVGDPSVRLKFFLDQFPDRSTFTTICQRNLSDGLAQIALLLKQVLGDPCIKGNLLDVDPDTAGEQFECSVSDVQLVNTPQQIETILPACDATNSVKPCWHIGVDDEHCEMSPKHRTLVVERAMNPPAETHTIMNCVTEATDNEP